MEPDTNDVVMDVRVAFDSIMSLDLANQQFGADLWISLTTPKCPTKCQSFKCGRCKQIKELLEPFQKKADGGRGDRWIASQNMVDIEDASLTHPAVSYKESDDSFRLSWRFLGKFGEAWELKNFPFDSQDFTVSMMIRYPYKDGSMKMRFACGKNGKVIRPKAFTILQNSWKSPKDEDDRLHVWEEDTEQSYVQDGVLRHTLNVTVQMGRTPWHYVSNIVFPLFLIVCMSASSIVIPPEKLSDRLSASLTLVLAAVAYKYVVAQMVPPIGYSTWLDHYVTMCFIFLFLVVLENCVAALCHSQHDQEMLLAGSILFGCFGLCNIVFAIRACWAMNHPSRISRKIKKTQPVGRFLPCFNDVQSEAEREFCGECLDTCGRSYDLVPAEDSESASSS